MPSTRERLIQIIDDWSDEPDSYEEWGSLLKVNVLIASEKEFGVQFNSAEIPSITGLTTLLARLEKPMKKVLVLDCDGVLWDGIVGEGTAYVTADNLNFQGKCRAFEGQGVLLALCSKNNPQDVHDAFVTLEAMSLTLKHIAAWAISWDSKVDGLRRLAADLNLGLDSFVFVDDSPIERAEVQERLPEVTVLSPNDTIGNWFPNLPGKSLTEQYRLRQTVQTAMDEAGDRQAFLDSLDMLAVMRVNDESLAPRIAELSQKTNQFNMTLRRFTESEILDSMDLMNRFVFCASLVDRFGDAGWVAMAVFEHDGNAWNLLDLCISCRVLGRGFERAFVEKCFDYMQTTRRWPIVVHYTPGPKNSVCANFFDGQKVADHVPRAPVKWENE